MLFQLLIIHERHIIQLILLCTSGWNLLQMQINKRIFNYFFFYYHLQFIFDGFPMSFIFR